MSKFEVDLVLQVTTSKLVFESNQFTIVIVNGHLDDVVIQSPS